MAQNQQMQGQIDQLVQGLNALHAQVQNIPAAAAAAPVRFRLHFDTYSFEEPDPQSAFDNFEQNVRVVTAAMGYPFPDVCNAVIGQLRGKAAQMVRDLVGNYNQFADLNAFLARLRQVFVSPAYQEKARAAFYLRLQQKGESIVAYHGIMRALWEKAFPADQRQEVTLIRQFIAGLISPKIMEQLHIRNFNTSQEALNEAMRFEGTYEILAMNIRRRENRGQLEPNPHMFLDTHSSVKGTSASSAPEPMEVGNFNQRGNSRGRGRGGNRGRGRGNQSNHNSTGQQNHQKKKDVNEIGKDQCRKCLGFGHWAPDCPSKNQYKPNRGRGQFRGNSGKRGKPQGYQQGYQQNYQQSKPAVHNIEEQADSDADAKNE
jgi:hypothetical protein